MNIDNAVFFGGMDNDNNPAFVKKGDYIYALNAIHNTTYAQGKYILSNEEGFSNFTNFLKKYPKDIILNITNIENKLIVFSVVVNNKLETLLSRIGIIEDGNYKEVLNDHDSNYWINNIIDLTGYLNFNINYQIQTFARKAYNNDIVVYWVDELNSPRFLNVSKDYKNISNRFKNIDLETRIFTKYDKPDIYIKDIINGGELIAGSYQFVCRYRTKEERESEWGLISNNVYIVKNDTNLHTVEGANYDYGYINKAIKLLIYNIDNGYDYLEIAVIRYKGNDSSIECFIFDKINIKNVSNNVEIIFDGRKKIKDITIDDILRKNVYYDVANVILQKDNRLFLGNLRASKLIDLQPIANDLEIRWKSNSYKYLDEIVPNYDKYEKLFNIDNNEPIIDIQNDLLISRGLKSFQREEAYSIGIVGVNKYGEETFAFHVPAKLPNQIDNNVTLEWSPYNIAPVNPDNPTILEANKCKAHSYQIFDFNNQNLNENGLLGVYFSEYEYKDKGIYFDKNGQDLYGKRVRHWLMPSYRMSPHFGYQYDNNYSLYLKQLHLYIEYNHLIYLYNKHKELFKDIKKLVLVRQKRDNPSNRSIYYMGLCNPMLIQDGFSKSHNSYTNVRNYTLEVTPDTNANKYHPDAKDRGFSAIVSPFHGNCYIYDEDKVCFYNGRFTYEWLYKELERCRLDFNLYRQFSYNYNTYAHPNNLPDIDVYSYYEHILRHSLIQRAPGLDIQLLSNEGINVNANYIYTIDTNVSCVLNTIYNNPFSHFGFIIQYGKQPYNLAYYPEDDKYTAVNYAKWYNRIVYQNKLNINFKDNNSILFDWNRLLDPINGYYFYNPLWYGKYTGEIRPRFYPQIPSLSLKDIIMPHLYAWSGISDRKEGKCNVAFYSPETLFYQDIYIPINSKVKPILEVMAMPYRVNDLNIRRGIERNTNIDSGLDITLANGDFSFIKSYNIVIDNFEDTNRKIRSGYWHIHHNWFFHVGKAFNTNKQQPMLFLELPNTIIPLEYNDYEFSFSYQSNTIYPSKNYNKKYWNTVQFYQWVYGNDIIKTSQDYLEKLKYFLYESIIKINNYDGERYLLINNVDELIIPELQTTYYLMLGNSYFYDITVVTNNTSYDYFNVFKNLEPQGLNNLIANNLLKFPKHILDWGCNGNTPSIITLPFKNNSASPIHHCYYPVYFQMDRRILEFYRDFDSNGDADNALYSNRYIYLIDSQNKSQYSQLDNNEYIAFDIIYNDLDFTINLNNVGVHKLSQNNDKVLTNGDVYVSMFYYRNSVRLPFYYETGDNNGYGGYSRIETKEGIELRGGNYIPIESEVNCFYRHRPVQKDNNGNFIGFGVRYYPLCNEREALNPESDDATNVNYNPQYSFQNDKKIYYLYPRNIEFQEYFKNRIIYSDLHVEGSVKDYLVEFRPDSYQDIPKDKGEITNMFKLGNDMYAQTTMSLFKLFVNPYEAINQNNLILTTSGVFQRPPIEIQSGISNTGGTYHKFSGVDTQYGYYFVDYYSKKVFLFGQTLEEISQYGMSNFFNNILNFEINSNDKLHNLSNELGVGIYSIFDKNNNRIITTIKYGKGKEEYYTLSYNLLNKKWTSFHSYKLSVGEEYLNSFVIANNERLNELKYGKGGDYGAYFGSNVHNFIIEYVFNKDFQLTKVFDNIMVDLEIYNIDKETSKYATVENRIKEKIANLK